MQTIQTQRGPVEVQEGGMGDYQMFAVRDNFGSPLRVFIGEVIAADLSMSGKIEEVAYPYRTFDTLEEAAEGLYAPRLGVTVRLENDADAVGDALREEEDAIDGRVG